MPKLIIEKNHKENYSYLKTLIIKDLKVNMRMYFKKNHLKQKSRK